MTVPPAPANLPLGAADDLPIHQIAQPIGMVGTSDRNFYDRYYFCGHHSSDELAFTAGLGQYPNLGVADAFLAVTTNGTQEVLRASKEMGGDRLDLDVGPISVRVVEGLARLEVEVSDNQFGIEAALRWEGLIPAHLEPRHLVNRGPRVVTDSVRFCQTGRWRGHLSLDGRRWDMDDDAWRGGRDRSWGIRPVGEPEPPGRRFSGNRPGFLWLYALMQFDEFTVVAIVQEDGEGRRSMDHAARIWNDGREAEQLGPLVHELDLDRDSRRLNKARLEAGELAIEVMPLVSSFLSLGTGYGTEPDWRHGAHQGPLVVQRRSYALSDPETVRAAYGLVDAMAEFTIGPHKGYGLFEYAVLGANARYQLEGKRR